MQYHSFTRIWVRILFLFHPFKESFFPLQGQRTFSAVMTVDNCLFHQTYRIPYQPRVLPLVWIAVHIGNSIPSFCIFTFWRVAGWRRSMRRPPWMRMKNVPPIIIDCLFPGGGLRGGVFHKCSNIYVPHPKTAPDQGMLNRYFPSWETPQRWSTLPCPSYPRFLDRGCCIFSWMCSLQHGDSNTPRKNIFILHEKHPQFAPPPQKDG